MIAINTCYIFAAAEGLPNRFIPQKSDLVIPVDAGILHLKKYGIKPDIAVGDFDSLGYTPDCNEVIQHPVMKNDTDTMLGIKTGLERGYKRFVIFGGTGKRPDHTYANYQSLCYIASHGSRGYLYGNGYTVTALQNGKINFKESAKGTISVFTNTTKSTGIYLKGLLYPLNDYTMTSDFPLGVSNEFIGVPSSVEVGNGRVLIMWDGGLDIVNESKDIPCFT